MDKALHSNQLNWVQGDTLSSITTKKKPYRVKKNCIKLFKKLIYIILSGAQVFLKYITLLLEHLPF